MRARTLLMLSAIVMLALFSITPSHASQQECAAGPASATNVTVGDFLSYGDAPGCSMTFQCDNDARRDCTLSVAGEVNGTGLVGVAAFIGDSALAECWAGLGHCVTDTATRQIAHGSTATVSCAFRNGATSEAVVVCRGALS